MTAPATAPTTATLSGAITNLDATPIVRNSGGGYAFGHVQTAIATITPTASQATSVLNRLVRIPSNAIVRKVSILLDAAATTLTGNIGLWYSDNTNDGTSGVNAGNLTAISSAFFAYQLVMGGFTPTQSGAGGHSTDPTDGTNVQLAQGPVEITFANAQGAMTDGQYIPSQSFNPIWQAVANSLALVTTPVGAFTNSSQAPHFATASAGGSVYVRSDDPGGYFDICLQLTSTGSAANVKVTLFVDIVVPG